MQVIFEALDKRIQSLPNTQQEVRKIWLNYKKGSEIFLGIKIQANQLNLYLNLSKEDGLNDPKGLARDISGVDHNGTGDYEVVVNSNTNMDDVFDLINQSYQIN
jgi:predicted transport protein